MSDASMGALPLDLDGPACRCCPHITQREVQADTLLREAWDLCPDSGCLTALCGVCMATARTERRAENDRYYAHDQPVRVIPERILDDRPGCTCWSYGQGGPHDPSCALEA